MATQDLTELDALAQVSKLVALGDIRQAKRAAAEMLDVIGPQTAALIATCARIQETYPNIAVAKLRAMWWTSDEHDRRVIEACAPKDGARRRAASTDQSAPRWTRWTTYQAPRNERRYNNPDARRTVHPEQKRTGRPVGVARNVADMYQDERAGIDDAPQHGERSDGYTIDYDRAALYALRGVRCAACNGERSSKDHWAGKGRNDDALCGECRERVPGIPQLPAGHTRADLINARCALIAAIHPARGAVTLLREFWAASTANRQDRPVITAWVAANPALTEQAAAELAAADRAAAELAAAADRAAELVTQEAEGIEYAAQYTAELAAEAAAAEQRAADRAAAELAARLAEEDAAEEAAAERTERLSAENDEMQHAFAEELASIDVDSEEAAAARAAIEQAAAQSLAHCECCYAGRSLHDVRNLLTDDGLCRDCRALDTYTSRRTASIDQPKPKNDTKTTAKGKGAPKTKTAA